MVADAVGHQPTQWVRGTGCNLCQDTGYRGRVGVYELLSISDAVRELIVGRATHHELRALAVEEGMRTMQEQAFQLVLDGVTTVDDVLRSVYAPGVDRTAEDPRELNAGAPGVGPGEPDDAIAATEDAHDVARPADGDRAPADAVPAP